MKHLHPFILQRDENLAYTLNGSIMPFFLKRIAILRWKFQLSRHARSPNFTRFLTVKAQRAQPVGSFSKSPKFIGTRSVNDLCSSESGSVPNSRDSWRKHGRSHDSRKSRACYSQFERWQHTLVCLSRCVAPRVSFTCLTCFDVELFCDSHLSQERR